jgi:hypothetical protein
MGKKTKIGTLQYHIAIIWEPNSNRYTLQFRCAFRCHLGTPILQSNRVARYYGPNYLNISINSGENVSKAAMWGNSSDRHFDNRLVLEITTHLGVVQVDAGRYY